KRSRSRPSFEKFVFPCPRVAALFVIPPECRPRRATGFTGRIGRPIMCEHIRGEWEFSQSGKAATDPAFKASPKARSDVTGKTTGSPNTLKIAQKEHSDGQFHVRLQGRQRRIRDDDPRSDSRGHEKVDRLDR